MDIRFNEEQEMIRQSARSFLTKECPSSLVREMAHDVKGYTEELWRGMGSLGWMGLIFPEEYGGTGGTFCDLVVLLEEMGRFCLPGPFFSTVILGGSCILDGGSDRQKRALLPKIAKGDLIITLAVNEIENDYNPSSITVSASESGGKYIINGTKLFVPDAHAADYILCVARTQSGSEPEGGITLFIVDGKTPGISCTQLKTIAGDKQCEVVFNDVEVLKEDVLGVVDKGWSVVKKVLQRAAVAKCAEMVGGGQQIIDITVSYVKEREQFGQPIGSFQAIQHHCVNMLVDLDSCRWVHYKTAWMIDEGLSYNKQVAISKAWCNEAYKRIVALGHQVLGGIAYCEEHDMHLYFRRARIAEVAFGDADFHRKIVAEQLYAQ